MSELSKQQHIRHFAHSSFDNTLLSKPITARFQYALILPHFTQKRKLKEQVINKSVNNACKYTIKNNRTGNNKDFCSKT